MHAIALSLRHVLRATMRSTFILTALATVIAAQLRTLLPPQASASFTSLDVSNWVQIAMKGRRAKLQGSEQLCEPIIMFHIYVKRGHTNVRRQMGTTLDGALTIDAVIPGLNSDPTPGLTLGNATSAPMHASRHCHCDCSAVYTFFPLHC